MPAWEDHSALAFSKARPELWPGAFTPETCPPEITASPSTEGDRRHAVSAGAILCNLFLADELNRATSRTQSALLEAMEEGQVTVDGVSHPLPEPFFVIATQNPAGASGTQLLPDSQIDRFAIRLSIGYPSPEAEREMVQNRFKARTPWTCAAGDVRTELIAMRGRSPTYT
jgi:MoxR-like ATPase